MSWSQLRAVQRNTLRRCTAQHRWQVSHRCCEGCRRTESRARHSAARVATDGVCASPVALRVSTIGVAAVFRAGTWKNVSNLLERRGRSNLPVCCSQCTRARSNAAGCGWGEPVHQKNSSSSLLGTLTFLRSRTAGASGVKRCCMRLRIARRASGFGDGGNDSVSRCTFRRV